METDLLNTNKAAHFALGQFAQDVLGTSTVFTGLACVPNTPAAMNVIVQPGAVYAQAVLDATAYSSLAADSTVTQKQGILKAAQTFATPAPTTSGQSVVYLISASFLEADTNAVVLPYYNASNPSQAYSGPSGTGASQNTLRQDTVQLTLTAGVPATTGNQLTPATPNGQIALYTVTVAYGATSVTAANIAKIAGAPFLAAPLLQQTSGRLLGVQIFTSSGTYTPGTYSGVTATKARVRAVGGGGAGGSVTFTTSAQSAVAGGGNSAALGEIWIASGLSSQAVTIGAGGTPAAVGNNPGNAGGATSFGALLVCAGGQGGLGGSGVAPPNAIFGNPSVATCSGSGLFIVSGKGTIGGAGMAFSLGSSLGGKGADSPYGGGGFGGGGGTGGSASGYGAGGGGAGQGASAGSGAQGGAGSPGYVIVEEYA